jgi:hypothetical protein
MQRLLSGTVKSPLPLWERVPERRVRGVPRLRHKRRTIVGKTSEFCAFHHLRNVFWRADARRPLTCPPRLLGRILSHKGRGRHSIVTSVHPVAFREGLVVRHQFSLHVLWALKQNDLNFSVAVRSCKKLLPEGEVAPAGGRRGGWGRCANFPDGSRYVEPPLRLASRGTSCEALFGSIKTATIALPIRPPSVRSG